MMALHVIVGAGPVGTALAQELAEHGAEVTVVTRSGSGPDQPGVRRVRADAADVGALAPHVRGAVALYNCANPPTYMDWAAQWPPLAAALLEVAAEAGAVLVTLSNLYGYGPVAGPMSADLPLAATSRKGRLRARMWQTALAAHRAGRVRTVEVRASDYVGPTTTPGSALLTRYALPVLAGRRTWVFGDPDAPHSWTYVPDIATTLSRVAAEPTAWGRVWHVPTNPPVSVRQALTEIARLGGAPPPRIGRLPGALVTVGGLVAPVLRELDELSYQFDRPFELDAQSTVDTLGLRATPWSEVLAGSIAGWRGGGQRVSAR